MTSLRPGDLLLLFTDGLTDNLHWHEARTVCRAEASLRCVKGHGHWQRVEDVHLEGIDTSLLTEGQMSSLSAAIPDWHPVLNPGSRFEFFTT